jgi:hypothetical protein
VIPKALVEDFGFRQGEAFEAKKTESGIALLMAGK